MTEKSIILKKGDNMGILNNIIFDKKNKNEQSENISCLR